mgnify:CR=1 FL=1
MDNNSLAHTKWECKYHIVFAPKYRRQVDLGEGIRAADGGSRGDGRKAAGICGDRRTAARCLKRPAGPAVFVRTSAGKGAASEKRAYQCGESACGDGLHVL